MATIQNYLCSICGKTLKTVASLKKHHVLHTGTKFCCEYCGKILASKRGLVSHLTTYHGHVTDKAYLCGFCGKHFTRKSTWQVHLNAHNGVRPFHCSICDKSFTQKKSLDSHKEIHSGRRIGFPKEKRSNDTGNSINSESNVLNAVVKCTEQSVDVENGESLASCYLNQSKELALTKLSLKIHSSNKKMHRCETCLKEFVDVRNLTIHRNRHHSCLDSIKHNCSFCQKVFGQKSKLMRHLKSHIEEPQFRCDICGKKYYRKDNLESHSKRHQHTVPELVCHICEKQFSEPATMEKHLNHHMHPSHSCLQCVKTFSTPAALKYHNAAHNKVSKYTCVHCSKTFIRKCHYDSHKLIHEKNFVQCILCLKRFNGDVYYKRHMKRAHPFNIL